MICLFGDSVISLMSVDFKFSIFKTSKKSLKIPKGQSESEYRRTDNTMVKGKSTKGHVGLEVNLFREPSIDDFCRASVALFC